MKPKYRRLSAIVFSIAIMGFAVYLLLSNLREHLIFFYSPTELASANLSNTQTIRIGGLVKEGSIIQNSNQTQFILTDANAEIMVSYTGLLPDLFREGQGIIARGKPTADRYLEADQLLAKHDENYMPKEVVDSLKATGHWKEEE